jgi:hypothetical protein
MERRISSGVGKIIEYVGGSDNGERALKKTSFSHFSVWPSVATEEICIGLEVRQVVLVWWIWVRGFLLE